MKDTEKKELHKESEAESEVIRKVLRIYRCKICLGFVETLDYLVAHWRVDHGISIKGSPRIQLISDSDSDSDSVSSSFSSDSEVPFKVVEADSVKEPEDERSKTKEGFPDIPEELGSTFCSLDLLGNTMNLNSISTNSTINTAGIFYQNSSLFTVPVFTPGITGLRSTEIQVQVPLENNLPVVPSSSDFTESLTENSFGCPICNIQFQTRSQLMSHTRKHMKDKLFQCTLCEQNFPTHKDLKTHMGDKTEQEEFSITCGICSGNFPTQECLSHHLNSHKQTGSAPVIIDNPSAERRYSCSLCNRTFKNSQHVQRHLRVHTGEKPFSCDVCGQSFSLNHNLQRHMRTHTGEKQHSCKICAKEFAEGHNLKRHMISAHDGPTPYICTICNKKFAENSILRKHQNKTHGKKAE